MHKVFGTEDKSKVYYNRPGAYLIPIKDGKVAVVLIQVGDWKGYFLLGGGKNEGETDSQTIARECLEEIGYSVKVGKKTGSGESWNCSEIKGNLHLIQTFYAGELVKYEKEPIEKDHSLVWLPLEKAKAELFHKVQSWAVEEAENALQ